MKFSKKLLINLNNIQNDGLQSIRPRVQPHVTTDYLDWNSFGFSSAKANVIKLGQPEFGGFNRSVS